MKVIEEEYFLSCGALAGKKKKKGLEEVQKDYPLVIKDVRGRGMMLGIELTKEGAGGMLMSLMIDSNILVAYTLNNPKVIRMEPPLTMPIEVIDQVLTAFRNAIQQTNAVIEEL